MKPRIQRNAYLEGVRLHEISLIAGILRAAGAKGRPARVVEIGGGSGLVANTLSHMGLDVLSFDPSPREPLQYDVRRGWGHELPVADGWADMIVSLHTLEHIPEPYLSQTLVEVRRVLRQGGRAVFMMPTPACMWFTIVLQPVANLKRWLMFPIRLVAGRHAMNPPNNPLAKGKEDGPAAKLLKALTVRWLFPPHHGVGATAIHELFAWRRVKWRRILETAGFRVLEIRPSGIAGSMHHLTGRATGPGRWLLGRLGLSKTMVFCVTPVQEAVNTMPDYASSSCNVSARGSTARPTTVPGGDHQRELDKA